MLWRFEPALCKKLYLCIYVLWVTEGFLFKIQVALIHLTSFTGLLLLMQKWQTMTLYIEHQMIYTYSLLLKSTVQMRAFLQHLESIM